MSSEESEVKLNVRPAGVVCYCSYYKSQQWTSTWVSEIMFLTKLKLGEKIINFTNIYKLLAKTHS